MCKKCLPYVQCLIVLVVLFVCGVLALSDDDNGPYRGKYLGKLNTYHHQVSGEVYAVDQYTFLFTGFNYDGNGADTFFWAGAANRPGPQGFIVPDEHGKTNILERYFGKDFTLTLPEGKKITEIKWISVYDLSSQNAFGDIYIPEEFEPPVPQKSGSINGKLHGVRSGPVEIRDSKTISITNFTYDGKGKDVHFLVGIGAQPSWKGFKVPDENGYMDPIRAYNEETFQLQLPGDLTVFNIQWFSIFDLATNQSYGSLLVSEALNVPPSLVEVLSYESKLPNCLQLHKNLQVSWEVFGPQITIQLAGQVGENDYMSFGLSGSEERSTMLNADVAVAYIDTYRGYATDYNITALAPCVKVLGQYRGVCKDDLVGGQDSFQLLTASRGEDGINVVTYRRNLISPDNGDKEYPLDREAFIVWAMGRLDAVKEPSFHDYYPKGDISVQFNSKEKINNCFKFTRSDNRFLEPWERPKIIDKSIRSFTATLGPSGGKRGYQGITGQTSSGLAWYINGMLVPELWLRRGLTYVFKVRGGNNPHSAEHYHPLIITDEPRGGFDRLTDTAQHQVRVLAGVEYTRRGRPKPTVAGPLCLAQHTGRADRRRDDDFPTFRRFNRTLKHVCEEGDPVELEVTPNSTWPDVVYYNSFTHSNMGWKIHIVDNFGRSNSNLIKIDLCLILLILTKTMSAVML